MIDGAQLRTGQLIEWGDRRTQKAVDTRLVADMVVVDLRNRVSDIASASDDADMLPGVAEVPAADMHVYLYGFGQDSTSGVFRHARDSTIILDPREDLADAVQLNVPEGPIPPAARTDKPLGNAESTEDLGVACVPGTRATPPGEDSLGDGTENTPSAADGDVTSPEVGTPEVPQGQRIVPFLTADRDPNCRSENNAVATPTAKADSPKFNEIEHVTKMGARETPAQVEYHAEAERADGSKATQVGSAVSGVSAASLTQQAQQTQPAQSPPVAMPGAANNTGSGVGNDTASNTGVKNAGASALDSASSTATDSGESATEPSVSENGVNASASELSP